MMGEFTCKRFASGLVCLCLMAGLADRSIDRSIYLGQLLVWDWPASVVLCCVAGLAGVVW